MDELDGEPSRARHERRITDRNTRARSDGDDDRWRWRGLPVHDASEHGRQHQRTIGTTPSGRRQRRRWVPGSAFAAVIRFRLVAAAVLLLVPAMARAQPQESAPPPASVDPRDLADRQPSLVEPDFTLVNLPTTLRLPRYKSAFRMRPPSVSSCRGRPETERRSTFSPPTSSIPTLTAPPDVSSTSSTATTFRDASMRQRQAWNRTRSWSD